MGFWGVFRKNASPELLKEQAPGIMMGPFPLAIYCLFVVTLGQITINQTRADGAESDFYPGWVCKPDSVIRGEDDDLMFNLFIGFYLPNIFFSYLILVTFIWSFIGFRVEININYFMKDAGEKNYALLLPFTKLSWLAGVYVFLIPCHFIVMLAGSIINTLAAPCIPDNLTVLAFSTFMVVMYWIIIVFKIVNQCVKTFGKQIGEGLKNVAKQAISKRNHELEFLANEFRKFEQADGHMDAGDLESLLVTLGVDLDNDAVEEARSKMDADESGTIELNEFMRWYQLEVGLSDKKTKSGKNKYEAVDSSDEEDEDDY